MFNKAKEKNKSEVDSSLSRPKTRRGLNNNFQEDTKQEDTPNEQQPNVDIWRPSSALDTSEPVDPLVGLDDIQNQTSRSDDQKETRFFSIND